jgi:hypothetical protein
MKTLSHCWKAPLVAVLIALTTGGVASAAVQSFSIDENATLSPGHQAIVVTGTITCTADIFAFSPVRVIQGDRTGSVSVFSQTCTGDAQPWSATVVSGEGLFRRKRASVGVTVLTQDASGLDTEFFDRFVRVR